MLDGGQDGDKTFTPLTITYIQIHTVASYELYRLYYKNKQQLYTRSSAIVSANRISIQ